MANNGKRKGKVLQARLDNISELLDDMRQDGQISSEGHQSLTQQLSLIRKRKKIKQTPLQGSADSVAFTPKSSDGGVEKAFRTMSEAEPVSDQDYHERLAIAGHGQALLDSTSHCDSELVDYVHVAGAKQVSADPQVAGSDAATKDAKQHSLPRTRCLQCDRHYNRLTRHVVSEDNRNNNAGRPYLKCTPCNKFCTWLDLIGVSEDCPDCQCGYRSRLQPTSQSNAVHPERSHYVCALGACDFFTWFDEQKEGTANMKELLRLVESLELL